MRESGIYENFGNLRHFIPHPLPPQNPPFNLGADLVVLYGEAMLALGHLNEIALRLPDIKRFIKAYVIKEALLSSEIDGIHTTLVDVFTQPIAAAKVSKETQLVLNYTKALDVALNLVKDDGLPIASRVILAAHEALMSLGEGDRSAPGQYRKQAVRVGSLVPPPAPKVPELMADLERYINLDNTLPPLIKAGLAHVQFETIHPFLDGNGRIGRLLIVLMLVESGLLVAPILYPSYFFKKHHAEYYLQLDKVRFSGDFESWITYYLTAIRDSSRDAASRVSDIEALEKEWKIKIEKDIRMSKMRETAQQALMILFQNPIIGISELGKKLSKTYNTAQRVIELFLEMGMISEIGGQARNRCYQFDSYLAVLEREYL